MKKLLALCLALLLSLSVIIVVGADSASSTANRWVLSTGTTNIYVVPVQLPKFTAYISSQGSAASGRISMEDISFQVPMAQAQEFIASFLAKTHIRSYILYKLDSQSNPILKITLDDAVITSLAFPEFSKDTDYDTPAQLTVNINTSRISTSRPNSTNSSPLQVTPAEPITQNGFKVLLDNKQITTADFFSDIEMQYTGSGTHSGGTGSGTIAYGTAHFTMDYAEPSSIARLFDLFDFKTNSGSSSVNKASKLEIDYISTNNRVVSMLKADALFAGQELLISFDDTQKIKQSFALNNVTYTQAPPAVAGVPGKITLKPGDQTLPKALAVNWSGKWDTTLGNMTLVQRGSIVTGTYGEDSATVEGKAFGTKLTGTWTDGEDTGDFEFSMAASNKTFNGRLRYVGTGDLGWTDWDGDKL